MLTRAKASRTVQHVVVLPEEMMVLKLEVETVGRVLSFTSPNVTTGIRVVANEPATNPAAKEGQRSRREIGSQLRKRPNGINEDAAFTD